MQKTNVEKKMKECFNKKNKINKKTTSYNDPDKQSEQDEDQDQKKNQNHKTSLITEKRLHLRDLRHQQGELAKEHINVKQLLQEKQEYFSLHEKRHNEEQVKMLKEYEQAMKDNQDRQIILEEKIKNKEKKIESYNNEIIQYKTIIDSLHERIKNANIEIETRERSLSFLTKFKNESIEFVQLDMFDRLETIYNSEKLIQKKKKELNDKISNIKKEIRNMEEQNNIIIKNKESEYKNLIKLSEEMYEKKKKIEEELKEHVDEHNQKHLLLSKIMSSIDNFLSRFITFLPELRHYNIKKNEERLLDRRNKSSDGFDGSKFIDTAELNNLEQIIIKKLDIVYKYIKDITYIIEKANKKFGLKEEN